MQNRAVYREGHVEAGIGKMVETLGFVLAAGAARVLAKHLDKPGQLCGRDVFLQRLWEVDLELLPGVLLDEAADGVGMAVGEGDVGFDVVDRRAIAQVRPEDVDDRALVRELDVVEFHAGEADGIGSEGTACGKQAHALASPKARRAHGGGPFGVGALLALCCRVCGDVCGGAAGRSVLELPQQPKMAEALEAGDGGVDRELGLEDDVPLQVRCEEAVARDAELLW